MDPGSVWGWDWSWGSGRVSGVHGRARPAQEPGGGAESVGGGGGSAVGSAGGSARGSAAGVHLEVARMLTSTREPGTHPRTPQRPGRTRRRSGAASETRGTRDGGGRRAEREGGAPARARLRPGRRLAVPAGGRERAGSRHAEAAPVGAAAVAAVAAIAAVHRVVTHASSEARASRVPPEAPRCAWKPSRARFFQRLVFVENGRDGSKLVASNPGTQIEFELVDRSVRSVPHRREESRREKPPVDGFGLVAPRVSRRRTPVDVARATTDDAPRRRRRPRRV